MSDYLQKSNYLQQERNIAMEIVEIANSFWKVLIREINRSDYTVPMHIRETKCLDWDPYIKIGYFFTIVCHVMKKSVKKYTGMGRIYEMYFSDVYVDFYRGINMWFPLGTIQTRQDNLYILWGEEIKNTLEFPGVHRFRPCVDRHLNLLLDCKNINKTEEDKKYDNLLKYVTDGNPYKIPLVMVMTSVCKNFSRDIIAIIVGYSYG